MFRRLYDWTLFMARHRHATVALSVVAFVESSVFPIPPDVMLIPMTLSHRERAWYNAFICTVFSVLGGIAGYAIGYFLFDSIGMPVIEFYNIQQEFAHFQALFDKWGFWFLLICGFTPLPYKVATIASGAMGLAFPGFVLISLLSRGARFFLVAGLLWRYGPKIQHFIDRYFNLLTLIICLVIIAIVVFFSVY